MKWLLLCVVAINTYAFADPVWHCSRNTEAEKSALINQQKEQFSIASVNSSVDTIGISINDLIDVYSGIPVRIGGLPLSACFIPSREQLTTTASTALGLQPAAIQALARKSAIIQSNLYFVTNEQQMLSCIAQHFPAVGYLDEPNETNSVQPCF